MPDPLLEHLLIGKPQPFGDGGSASAIRKQEQQQGIWLGFQGLEGNEVADIIHHGGEEKAVHHYPKEHYAFWRKKYGNLEILEKAGAFGENLSSRGMTEDKLCLGDAFRIGRATIECSHARQPCWKLNHQLGQKDVLKTVLKTSKSGSYFRVLEEGIVRRGNAIEMLDQPLPEWPLERVFKIVIGGEHKGKAAELRFLKDCRFLAEPWRRRSGQLLSQSA